MRIERHIYGSIRGYQTLARTDGITGAEARVLEGLSIGAPASPALMAALNTCPAYIVLPLGARRALTQIRPGALDDQGRPTLLHLTAAIAAPDWNTILQGNILPLIQRKDLWQWDGQAGLSPLDLPPAAARATVSPRSAAKLLALLSLLERGMERGGPVVVRQQDCTLEEFCLLERLLPPSSRASLTLTYRGFGPALRTSFLCIAGEAGGVSTGNLYRPDQPVDLSPYARAVEQAGFRSGRVPESLVRSYPGFGATLPPRSPAIGTPFVGDMPPQVIVKRTLTWMSATLVVVCLLFAVLAGVSLWMYSKTKRGHDQTTTQLQTVNAGLKDADEKLRITSDLLEAMKKENQRISAELTRTGQEKEAAHERIDTLEGAVVDLLKVLSLPMFDQPQRKIILDLARQRAELVPAERLLGRQAREQVTLLDGRRAAMDRIEADASMPSNQRFGPGSSPSEHLIHDPLVEQLYAKIIDAAGRFADSKEQALTLPGPSEGEAPAQRGPASPPADRAETGPPGTRDPGGSQPPSTFELERPSEQKFIPVLDAIRSQLDQLRDRIDRIRRDIEAASKSIRAVDNSTDRRSPDQKRLIATAELKKTVQQMEQWQKALEKGEPPVISLPWVQMQVNFLRTGLPHAGGLVDQGAPPP